MASSSREVKLVKDAQLRKTIPFFGLVALGLGGIWGNSWLLVSSAWMGVGGGVVNALIAWGLVFLLEMPLVLAYRQAVPLFPKAGGEMSYAEAAFGKFAGFIAGWFGILVNLIICAYEVLALVRMAEFLSPRVTQIYWYKVMGWPVGIITIILGLALIAFITLLHYRGVKVSSGFQTFTSVTLMILTGICVVIAFALGSFENWKPLFTKPVWAGVIGVACMLPFSLAGWETIAKGAEEAADSTSKSGSSVPIAWTIGWAAYVLTFIATALVMPWTQAGDASIPFAEGLNNITGGNYLGLLLIITALIGVVGVYNALFFGVTRQMFGMARQGMLPKWLSKIHPKYGTPSNAVLFTSAIMLIAPFVGRKLLIPFVDAASFAYIILWGATFLSVEVLRRRYRAQGRVIPATGGLPMRVLGFVSILFFLVAMLYPKSPGALVWPLEHLILGGLVVLGLILYAFRSGQVEQAS